MIPCPIFRIYIVYVWFWPTLTITSVITSSARAPHPSARMLHATSMQITKVQQQCVMILQKAAGQPIVMEKDLRKDLGNTPDTSKALRLWVHGTISYELTSDSWSPTLRAQAFMGSVPVLYAKELGWAMSPTPLVGDEPGNRLGCWKYLSLFLHESFASAVLRSLRELRHATHWLVLTLSW